MGGWNGVCYPLDMSSTNRPDSPDTADANAPIQGVAPHAPIPEGIAPNDSEPSETAVLPEHSSKAMTRSSNLRRDQDSLELSMDHDPAPSNRRMRLPLMLFIATAISTFWVGMHRWLPFSIDSSVGDRLASDWVSGVAYIFAHWRQLCVAHWQDGLVYMACVMGILLTHEMGHFLATLRYRVPASFPYFVPLPISPIGTMGAVIGMDSNRANRRETFDIGLAGPLAGLLVAIPVMCLGIAQLDLRTYAYGPFAVDLPLFARLAIHYIQPPGFEPGKLVWYSQLNPVFMAGWVGFLVTGLNMLPVSQLDGGHVVYTLFGRRAHWIARGFVLCAICFVVVSRQWNWFVMIALVMFIGPDHPPTRDDDLPLGWIRTTIGCLALLIPLFCFTPWLFIFPY